MFRKNLASNADTRLGTATQKLILGKAFHLTCGSKQGPMDTDVDNFYQNGYTHLMN